ncbi:hypothetical protein JCM24511_00902 [Saitozyma sp. JCM 24511]|nr:hypothetical protein JCM24511_00902 [Saitozyma sp. JCM 24511]
MNYLAVFDLTSLEARKRAIRKSRAVGGKPSVGGAMSTFAFHDIATTPEPPSLIRSLFRKSARPRRGIPWGIAWHFKFMSVVDEARWLQEEMDSTLLELKENRRKANEMQQAHQSLTRRLGISMFW